MLSIASSPAIFLHTEATDMRKSFTGLCGLVRGVLGDDPSDGSVFPFVNNRRDRIKALPRPATGCSAGEMSSSPNAAR